jgi:hypothetical protein
MSPRVRSDETSIVPKFQSPSSAHIGGGERRLIGIDAPDESRHFAENLLATRPQYAHSKFWVRAVLWRRHEPAVQGMEVAATFRIRKIPRDDGITDTL